MAEVSVFQYINNFFVSETLTAADDLRQKLQPDSIAWINIEGLENQELLENIRIQFNLHPLIIEDLHEISEHTKTEIYDESIFIVLRMLTLDTENTINTEHVSIVLGNNFVITFQEGKESDVFDSVREHLRHLRTKNKAYSADYICYLLLHALADSYSDIIDASLDQIEDLEERVLTTPSNDAIFQIHHLRNNLMLVKKSIAPLRDMIMRLSDEANDFVLPENISYFRYLYNHSNHSSEMLESAREMIMALQDLYLSSISTRMNEIMKVLTIITTIFIPLSFLVGLYGMNFKYMPELEWPYSYPILLICMGLMTVGMLKYFKWKKWL
ncbi:MAG: magnesium/cobalt transporter CorA [Ignavibacteria bacterium]|nr:magnesium/cobalt transporter CorA [Ignavibacteria bacterium]